MGSNPILPNVEFNEDGHTYTVNGEEMTSVTTILADSGITRKDKYPMFAATKGKDIHKLIQLSDENDLDMVSLDDNQYLHLVAWHDARKTMGLTDPKHELIVFHSAYKYAGTVDVIDWASMTLVEIKSGNKEKWHPLQVAGYKLAFESYFNEKLQNLYIVYTKPEYVGKNIVKVEDTEYLQEVFTAALKIAGWKNAKSKRQSRDSQYDDE